MLLSLCMYSAKERREEERRIKQNKGETDRQMDRQTDGQTDWWTDRQMVRQIDGVTDRWMEVGMDGWEVLQLLVSTYNSPPKRTRPAFKILICVFFDHVKYKGCTYQTNKTKIKCCKKFLKRVREKNESINYIN